MSGAAEFGHLDPHYRRYAALPDRERIHWIQADRWIGFDQAQAALDRLERAARLSRARPHAVPADFRRHRHGENKNRP